MVRSLIVTTLWCDQIAITSRSGAGKNSEICGSASFPVEQLLQYACKFVYIEAFFIVYKLEEEVDLGFRNPKQSKYFVIKTFS